MGAGRVTAPAAPGSRRVPGRALLIAGAVLALALGAGLVALLSGGDDESPRYDEPAEMLAIARDAGMNCEEWRFGTIGSGSEGRRLVCFANGVERDSHAISFVVTQRENVVGTWIDNRFAPDGSPVRPGDRWIVGDSWMVEIDRGLVPAGQVERIADRLGGDVKRW
jgi:hypothetical protein